jgi:hypothetical protein
MREDQSRKGFSLYLSLPFENELLMPIKKISLNAQYGYQ